MKTTIFDDSIIIGEYHGETVTLAPPSWNCGWYWGFGYIQNDNLHTHFDSIGEKNMFDNIKESFTNFIITDDSDLWKFCELMQTFYTLKKTAEVFGRGGSNYSTNPCSELVKNTSEAARINEIVLPAIFDQIYLLISKK